MRVGVRENVAVVDLRGDRADWSDLEAELERVRTSGEANVVVLAVDGGTRVHDVDAEALKRFELFELPVVVALEGGVANAAANLALAGDIRVCDRSLQMTLPAVTGRLRLLVGDEAADDLSTKGAVTAQIALASGLVSRVAPEGQSAVEFAEDVARIIAPQGPIATRLGKEAIWRGLAMPLEQALRFETDLTLLLQTTKDRAEGVSAFLEKRAPQFTGE